MLAIGSDHAGFALKEALKQMLDEQGIEYKDFGTHTSDSVDYPDIAAELSKAVAAGAHEKGLLVCGTGIGMSMAANKVAGIRAAACSDYFSAKATRQHNNANVLCLGERVIGPGLAWELLHVFLTTEFEGDRHARRVDKIMALEENN